MIIDEVKEILMPFLEENKFELYDVVMTSEANMQVLRVLIDKEGGITVDDLVLVNNYLSEKLDSLDDLNFCYNLEVSSPGAERPLRNALEVEKALNDYVNVNYHDQIYEGQLIEFKDGILVIRVNLKGRFKNFNIPYNEVSKIRKAIKF